MKLGVNEVRDKIPQRLMEAHQKDRGQEKVLLRAHSLTVAGVLVFHHPSATALP